MIKLRGELTPRDGAIAVGLTLIGAIIGGVGLFTLSTPPDAKGRVAAVEAKADRAKGLLRPSRNAQRFGPGAVCVNGVEAQSLATKDFIIAYGGETGLQLRALDVRPEYLDGEAGKLAPVAIRFEATGSYDATLGLLDRLSRERPQVFVDAVDLTAKTSVVTLVFTGRLFCSA